MLESIGHSVLLVASHTELPRSDRSWGHGGWLMPESREALDWLTLARLMGWDVAVTRPEDLGREAGVRSSVSWVIVACAPDDLGEESLARLASWLAAEPILIVARAASADRPFARLAGASLLPARCFGRQLRCIASGSEREWSSRMAMEADRLALAEGTAAWATLDGAPILTTRAVGQGTIATLGFHPSRARDTDGTATALLIHLLTRAAAGPVAWLDWSGCLVLRMDDPGGAQNVHSRTWSYPKLDEAAWSEIRADLRRRGARISLAYVAGWVDDGEPARGELEVDGHAVDRIPGATYPSPRVRYRDHAGHLPGTVHDYQAEYRGIQALRSEGLGDVELHGYTHMHPDTRAWTEAPDRYESWPATSWYREFGRAAEDVLDSRPPHEHPLTLGLSAFREHFGIQPTTLICPGDQWTTSTLERALDLGLVLVGSYYLALREGERFCWTTHVCAPYLDEPSASRFDAGLPVVGYFHDSEPALEGVGWMSRWLDEWQAAGAARLIDFRELAAAVGRRLGLRCRGGVLHLTVHRCGAPALVRPLPVMIRVPGARLPAHISAVIDGWELSLEVEPLGGDLGRVVLPAHLCGGDTAAATPPEKGSAEEILIDAPIAVLPTTDPRTGGN